MGTNEDLSENGAGRSRPRRLLICLDGVPYEVIADAKGRGLFAQFNAPSRLLSPFPTMTNVALSLMLGATAPLGYESLYFDRRVKQLRGGVRKYMNWRRTPANIPSSYMDDLDYQEPLPFEFLIYVAPQRVWRADFARFRERFRAAPQTRDYFAFLKGTDGLLHICGRRHLDVALESLDQILREINSFCGTETEIVLFSDHGMNLRENQRSHLQTHLRRRNYAITGRLNGRRARDVVVPAFGLCGYAAAYCAPELVTSLAADLAELRGVDFTIHREGGTVVVTSAARGVARLHRRADGEGASFRYEPVGGGDPLRLAQIVESMSCDGLFDAERYASDEAWRERTAEHIYPDALANLYCALHAPHIQHPADVLASFEDGYYYGSSLFSRIVRIAATHGNAMRASSTAFLMSTHRDFAPHVRAAEVRPLLKG
jgi:hypothetical protein